MKAFVGIPVALMLIVAAYLLGRASAPTVEHTERVTVYDTVRHYLPVAKDSLVARYVTRALPMAKTDADDVTDSVAVVVPVTQVVYEDSLYRAYVSGYEPRLDSIFVISRTEYVNTVTTKKEKTKRWSVGPYVGLGVAPCGRAEPSIGLSVQYSLIKF